MAAKRSRPNVVMIGGPNGAGKTTAPPVLLHRVAGVTEFVNADSIASAMNSREPEQAAIAAGRAMLARLRELAEKRISFGFETTLASRSFSPWGYNSGLRNFFELYQPIARTWRVFDSSGDGDLGRWHNDWFVAG